jgi:hypothetical protein
MFDYSCVAVYTLSVMQCLVYLMRDIGNVHEAACYRAQENI